MYSDSEYIDSSSDDFDTESSQQSNEHDDDMDVDRESDGHDDSSDDSEPQLSQEEQEKLREYETLELLGSGQFGEVYEFTQDTVIKTNKDEYSDKLRHEAKIHKFLNEVDIGFDAFPKFYWFKKHGEDKYFLKMEKLTGFESLTEVHLSLSENQLSVVLFQILYILYKCHDERLFVHGDLISDNVMIRVNKTKSIRKFTLLNGTPVSINDEGIDVKLIDFGSSRMYVDEKEIYNIEQDCELYGARFDPRADMCKILSNPIFSLTQNYSRVNIPYFINETEQATINLRAVINHCKSVGKTHIAVPPFPEPLKYVNLLTSSLFTNIRTNVLDNTETAPKRCRIFKPSNDQITNYRKSLTQYHELQKYVSTHGPRTKYGLMQSAIQFPTVILQKDDNGKQIITDHELNVTYIHGPSRFDELVFSLYPSFLELKNDFSRHGTIYTWYMNCAKYIFDICNKDPISRNILLAWTHNGNDFITKYINNPNYHFNEYEDELIRKIFPTLNYRNWTTKNILDSAIAQLDNIIEHAPLCSEELTLFRGVKSAYHLTERISYDDNFRSTSVSESFIINNPSFIHKCVKLGRIFTDDDDENLSVDMYLQRIKLQRNTACLPLLAFSQYDEGEVLLGRNLKWELINHDIIGNATCSINGDVQFNNVHVTDLAVSHPINDIQYESPIKGHVITIPSRASSRQPNLSVQ